MSLRLPTHVSEFKQSLRLLRTPRFGTYYIATLLSNMGSWSQQVAEPWLLLSLGASSFLIGLDAFVQSAPALILILVGGMLADKADRRRVITTFQVAKMMCPVALVALLLAHLVEPWMVVTLSLIVGVTDAISMPSFQTIGPSIVRRDQIPTAIALNATQFNLSRILGPALAGVLMASVGAIGCFAANAASYLPFIAVALWILPGGPIAAHPDQALDRRHLFLGLRRIVASEHMRGCLVTVLTTSALCGPLIVFCPVLVKEVLRGDATQFSLSVGAFGVGGLLGAIVMLGIEPDTDRRKLSSRSLWRIDGVSRDQSLDLSVADCSGTGRLRHVNQQHLGQFPPAGNSAGPASRQNHQPLYAGDARGPLDRKPVGRHFRQSHGRALRAPAERLTGTLPTWPLAGAGFKLRFPASTSDRGREPLGHEPANDPVRQRASRGTCSFSNPVAAREVHRAG